MKKLSRNQQGFSVVETIMAVVIVILIAAVGYMVYKNHHKTVAANTAASRQPQLTSTLQPGPKYLTVSAWGVRVPYTSSDTLSLSHQSCTENGDANGDTVNLGCQVTITSRNLAKAVGSCTAKVDGTVGYFYKMGPNDNYSATNGSGFTPVADWAAQNPGQYTHLGNDYYAFAPIGKATGLTGAAVASSSEMNGSNTGCSSWQSNYATVSSTAQAMAPSFEAIPH